MPIPILVYTHSDYSFLWKAAIPLLEKYAPDFEIIWCCDSICDFKIPSTWKVYKYDPSLSWGFRVKGCLETIESDHLIYIQEDWLLIDSLCKNKLEHCLEFMKDFNCEFLMSYAWNNRDEIYISDEYNNYAFMKMFSHYFQPAIWKKSLLYTLCNLNGSIAEYESEKYFNITKDRNCFGVHCLKNDKQISTRSFFFPHVHAIYQGKWTFYKYPCLKAIVDAYGVDTSARAIDYNWIPEFQ
jgi:hypothetical protein